MRRILTALYMATGGEGWKNSTNWLSDEPVHRWYGVTTASAGRVTGTSPRTTTAGAALSLPGNDLSGTIPPELGKLIHLRELDLSDNGLTGSIPPELGNLVNLELLNLSGNRLSGSLPAELGSLRSLRSLFLQGNADLSGTLPLSLSGLTNLQSLDVSGTELCAPADATFQGWLEGVATRRGVETCGPASDRRVLMALYEATGGPTWTNSANWLSDASLDQWHGVTVNTSGRVDSLMLTGNGLTGPIPASLGDLSALVSLDLSDNELSGVIPSSLGKLTDLALLDLSDNRLTGPIPAVLFTLSKLTTLDLSGNLFTLTASTDRDALVALYEATDGPNWTINEHWLSDEPLEAWHGVSTDDASGRVDSLMLAGNGLSGSIPVSLGDLTAMVSLDLSSNELSGTIPSSLGNLTSLTLLDLSDNRLLGPIPPVLFTLANLETLDLSGNLFNTSVSTDRDALVALYHATDGPNWKRNDNWLSDKPIEDWHGVYTHSIGQVEMLGRVKTLALRHNQLSGSIPPELGYLSNLKVLDLDSNQLSGSIPPELGNLSSLIRLEINWNQLSGLIPSELGNLSILTNLELYGNQLSGSIPPELGNLSNLTWLQLGGNQLSGSIPDELGNLSNLTELELYDNYDLSGPLPATFTNLRNLAGLSLSGTGLCAPADEAFQVWLAGIERGNNVATCGVVSEQDRAALVALYHATDGPNWKRNDNWLSDRPLGGWYGVDIDAAGRVTSLELYVSEDDGDISRIIDNGLSGSLPPELGDLIYLRELWLFGSELSGPIPSELGNLTYLRDMDLSDSRLSGSIPPELGNLSSLQILDISYNQLSGSLPTELGSLSNLEGLDLSYNSALYGPLPGSFTDLDNLAGLSLDGTGLCAPTDAAFQAWLEGIQEKPGVVNCTTEPPTSSIPTELIGQWNNVGNNFEQKVKENVRAYLTAQGSDPDEISAEVDSWTVTLEFIDFRSNGVAYSRDDGSLTSEPYTVTGNRVEFVESGGVWTYSVTGDRLTLTSVFSIEDLLTEIDEDPFFDDSEKALLRAAYEGIEQLIFYFDRDSGS